MMMKPTPVYSPLKTDHEFFIRQIVDHTCLTPNLPTAINRHNMLAVSVYLPNYTGLLSPPMLKPVLWCGPPQYDLMAPYLQTNSYVFSLLFTQRYISRYTPLYELFTRLPFFKCANLTVAPFELDLPTAAVVTTICQRICEEYQSDHADQFDLINAHFLTLLLLMKRIWETPATRAPHLPAHYVHYRSMLVNRFTTLVKEDNFCANCKAQQDRSVAWYARQLNVHPNYLNNMVKKETGKTAHDFIMEHVIEFSKYLLMQTSLTIKEIAYKLDFYDAAHFSTMFKKHTHLPPRDYRIQTMA